MPTKKNREFYAKIAEEKGGKMLSLEYINCMTKYLWECEHGHVWKTSANNIQRHYWCQECSGNKKKTIQYCKEVAEDRGGLCLSDTYVNNRGLLTWQCSEGHTWETSLFNVLNNHWCHECGGSLQKTIEDCYNLAKDRGFEFLSTEYIKNSTKYLWRCEHGHEWESQYQHIRNGSGCPFCSKKARHTIEDCIRLAEEKNGELMSTEYINNKTDMEWKCCLGHVFISTFQRVNRGEWCPDCSPERRIRTNMKRHGVKYPTQNRNIALKVARKSNNSYIELHWKTGEELVCQARWELKVVQWLNDNKIDFLWQPKTFEMPNGNTYRPDAYLVDDDLWIEVKGYMRPKSKPKWEWFHKEYPNSELWDKDKLKSLNIL